MAAVTSRAQLIEYSLRRLGAPVIEINVDPDQVDDRIDEALGKFQEFHSEATVRTFFKHMLTDSDMSNGYVDIPASIPFLTRMFPLNSSFSSPGNFFDFKYQLALNNVADMLNYVGDLAYYQQIQQYISTIDMIITGLPLVTFSRHQRRLYIHSDIYDGDLVSGQYIICEGYEIIDPETHTPVYNNSWLKKYTTALIKRQWGTNLSKFDGMVLPGGVTLNGKDIANEADDELEKLEEELRTIYEDPVDFFVG